MNRIRTLVTMLAFLMAGAVFAAEPIDINIADAAALAQAIKGVGLKKGAGYRCVSNGARPFHVIDDLSRISGIGEKTVNDSKENITVSPSGS